MRYFHYPFLSDQNWVKLLLNDSVNNLKCVFNQVNVVCNLFKLFNKNLLLNLSVNLFDGCVLWSNWNNFLSFDLDLSQLLHNHRNFYNFFNNCFNVFVHFDYFGDYLLHFNNLWNIHPFFNNMLHWNGFLDLNDSVNNLLHNLFDLSDFMNNLSDRDDFFFDHINWHVLLLN